MRKIKCQNCRRFSKHKLKNIDDKNLIPNITDVLDMCGKSQNLVTLNLVKLKLQKKTKKKLNFKHGQVRFIRMHLELKNSPLKISKGHEQGLQRSKCSSSCSIYTLSHCEPQMIFNIFIRPF